MKTVLIILTAFTLFSCGEDPSTDFSGEITLVDEANNSQALGQVSVRLYNLADYDSFVSEIISKNSGIGIPINQKTAFCFNDPSNVLAFSDITDPSGRFKISNVKSGTYNLVIEKEGLGIIEEYELEISGNLIRDYSFSKMDTLSGVIASDTILETGRNYYVNGVLSIENGSKLTIQGGSNFQVKKSGKILVSEKSKLKIEGTSDHPVKFYTQNWEDNWNGIIVEEESTIDLNYVFIRNSFQFIVKEKSVGTFLNSSFERMSGVISVSSEGSITIENSLLYKKIDDSETISISPFSKLILRNSIISNSNLEDIYSVSIISTNSQIIIDRNAFINSIGGIGIGNANDIKITQNLFYNISGVNSSGNGLYAIAQNGGGTSLQIFKNNFLMNRVNINTSFNSAPTISENNFFPHDALEWNIFMNSGEHEGQSFVGDVDFSATNNYWGSQGPNSIRDVNTPEADPRTGTVFVSPFSNIQIVNGAPIISE